MILERRERENGGIERLLMRKNETDRETGRERREERENVRSERGE